MVGALPHHQNSIVMIRKKKRKNRGTFTLCVIHMYIVIMGVAEIKLIEKVQQTVYKRLVHAGYMTQNLINSESGLVLFLNLDYFLFPLNCIVHVK